MNLEELNIGNFDGLIELENANVNIQAFYKIIEIVKLSLRKLDIIPEGLQLYYQRNIDTTSILAIQVIHGEYNDIDNYMFNGSKAWQHGSNVNCDVYMHSEAKSAQISMKLASLISNDIVEFFEEIERDLLKKNNFDLTLSLMMPLDIKKEKEECSIKKLIKGILKNNRNK